MPRGLVAVYALAQVYVHLLWDIAISLFYISFGAALPNLQVPHTSLQGKVAIVTGANSGIGYQLSLDLARQGATVYLACRNASKGQQAADAINESLRAGSADEKTAPRAHVLELDTSSLAFVRKCAATWKTELQGKPIDVLVHNAGISSAPKDVTDEGLGMIYATNFLGSFVLTSLLEQFLADGARVIYTSAIGQYGGELHSLLTSPGGVPREGVLNRIVGRKTPDSQHYANTKLMMVAFVHLLQQRWKRNAPFAFAQKALTAHAFTPGYVYTPIFSKTADLPIYVDPVWWFLKALTFLSIPVEQGAATGLWLATANDLEVRPHGGGYWDRMTRRATPVDTMDQGVLERVWQCWERDGGVAWN